MKKRAIAYIIIAGVCWGTSGIFVHLLAPYGFTSFQMTGMRALVSFVCMALFALVKDRSAFKVKPKELLLYAGIGASLFFTGSCYFLSMQLTSVSTAVMLMYIAPVYVMIFSVLFMGEKFTRLKLISVACMLVGCCLVSGIIGGLRFNAVGILLGFASGVAFASYNILTKISMQRKCKPVSVTLYSFMFMTLISLFVMKPAALIECAAKEPARTLPILLALGICTFVIPYVTYTLAMKVLPAGTASALGIVEPMSATVFSVILFDEKLGVLLASGIILILLAVFLLSRAEENIK